MCCYQLEVGLTCVVVFRFGLVQRAVQKRYVKAEDLPLAD